MTAFNGPVHGTWEPPPATRWEDGFLSGNGDHGALVFGEADTERVVVTHHTLVRPGGDEHRRPPRLAAKPPALQDRLPAGDGTAAEGFTDGRTHPWVRPFHPAFQIRPARPAADCHDYRRDVDFTTGVVRMSDAGWTSRVFVSRAASPENRPANASRVTINAAMDLSAARHALRPAADYHPGPDADRRRALADRLPPHRINADGALAEWAWPGLQDSDDHRHLSHLHGVRPLDEITPYDTPDLAAAAHRALELRGAENDSAHGHLHDALIAARLGDGERVAQALGQVLDGDFFHASLTSTHHPNRHVHNADAAHTLPAVLIETLVQSTPHRLVLLPALPPALPAGRLTGVRTRFGAEVDLTWAPGGARAVLRPTRTVRIEVRTSSGDAEPIDLVAGEDHVLSTGAW